ncbi:autotransporter domain-containing protein [Sphingomonas sp. LaA6.9]|uniref:autotransporter domain-containing protein n=1 Tax=Sphingomonas sp. LaA6.9 TaxID=2919914 RepID=UPI001F4F8EB3|nr:autotransporter domain-containing protein [Sphingomonas sp. LaA6.9]MCJ8157932.1 autotransporter domain-containing protein [Sphingomonas sp. LaA6.9]
MTASVKTRSMITTALVATTNLLFAQGTIAAPYGVHHTMPDTLTATFDTDDVIAGDKSGIMAELGRLDVTNAGEIRGNGTSDDPTVLPDAGIVLGQPGSHVVNSGTISGANAGITTTAAYNPASGLIEGVARDIVVENSGTIIGDTNDGVRLIGGGTITNNGTIEGRLDGARADGVSAYAFELQDLTGIISIATVQNETSGTIAGARHGVALSTGGTLQNAGEILGQVRGVFIQSTVAGMIGTASNAAGGTISGADGVVFGGILESASLTNSGAITGTASYGVQKLTNGLMTVDNLAGGEIIGARSGIMSELGVLNVTNAGDIRGNGTADDPTALPDAGIVIGQPESHVINSGNISGANAGITTTAAYNPASGLIEGVARDILVENSGTIVGDSNDGVRLIGGGTVINSGTIEGRLNSGRADGVSTSAFAGQDVSGPDPVGTVINQMGGTILGARGGVIHLAGGTVENAGTITGGVVGVQIQNNSATPVDAQVTNTGTISGADGVVVLLNISSSTVANSGTITGSAGNGVYQGGSGTMTLNNAAGGTISGITSAVLADLGAIDLDNVGTIRGTGTYDGLAGLPDGGVTLVTGLSTIVNSGEISGAGHGISTAYFYNAATTQLEGRALGTSITNNATGTIRGDSNDGVRLIGGGTVTNSGTIIGTGAAGADGISMFAYQGPAATGANTVAQDLTGRTSIGTVNNLVGGTITGQRFGIISSTGGTVDNAGAISGQTGGVYIQSTVAGMIGTLENSGTVTGGNGVVFGGILQSANLTNSGTITGAASYGVHGGTSGALTLNNEADGEITGARTGVFGQSGAVTLDNAGTIRGHGAYDGFNGAPEGGVTLAGGVSTITNSGEITGAGHGISTAYFDNAATTQLEGRAVNTQVTNSGTIRGDSNDGVRLIGGGMVTNSGTITGTGAAGADGISMFAYQGPAATGANTVAQDLTGITTIGTVNNLEGGTITGQRYGIILSYGGAVANAGSVVGQTGGVLIQSLVAGATATLTNSGTITGGVVFNVDTATANNNGTIVSGTGVAFTSHAAVTLTNSGALTGGAGTAATLSGFDDSLVLKTGSVITGTVDGGAGFDSIMLEGTSAVATATQSITQTNGFEQLSVKAGYWNTSATVGLFDAVTIAANGTLQLNEVASPGGAESPIATSAVVNDGLLVFNFDDGSAIDDADDLVISGTGDLRLIGEAIFTVDTEALAYTGTTEITNGGLILTGGLAGDVVTSGDGSFQLGDGGTTGSFTGDLVNNGSFVFNRSDDYDFLGDFSGTGDFAKMGAGTLTFGGDYSYTGVTRILGGTVRLAGQIDPTTEVELGGGTFDISGTSQTIASLSGTDESSVVINDSTLTVDQDSNTEYAGDIAGDGSLVLTGDGRLNLTGNSTYTGPTTVEGGTLSVNGSIVSTVTVDGGTLGGNGTVGGIVATGNGTVAPGNSIGHLQVAGNISFAAGSVYEVEVEASGAADRIDATGTATISGGTVEVLAANGQYRGRTDYTILTANGGVTGRFGNVTSNLAFLTPSLGYSANAVTLTLLRNDIDFAAVAVTPNQASTANAVEALGVGNTLFEAVLVQNQAGARTAYDALSGELHASVPSALVQDSRHVRDALTDSIKPDVEGFGIWGQGMGSWGQADVRDGVAKMTTEYRGMIAGLSFGGNGFGASLGGGIANADYRASARDSSTDVDTQFVGGLVGYAGSGFAIRAGAAFAWHDLDTTRGISFPGVTSSVDAQYDAESRQFFAEAGYSMAAGPFTLEPFARYANVRVKTDGFSETGGTGVLDVEGDARKVDLLALGVKLGGAIELGGGGQLLPRVSAAWQHASGDLQGRTTAGFVGATGSFTVLGSQLPQDTAIIDGGVSARFGNVEIGAGYIGSVAGDWADHGGKLTFSVHF